MDVTKLFEISNDKLEPLDTAKLDAMIENAVAYPQIRVPANQNNTWIRRAVAVAAAIVIAVTVSLQFMPATVIEPTAGISSNSDVYDEMSDLLILETLNDLS